MKHHTQLRDKDRSELSVLVRAGLMQKDIAKILGKDPSTISRELKRNKEKRSNYDAIKARDRVKKRRKRANKRFKKINGRLRKYVVEKLKAYWSPEQIAGRLKREAENTIVCHETIYRFIYNERPDLKKYLRCKKGKYRRRYGSKKRDELRKQQSNIKRIDERPAIVEERMRIGDWEGDTVIAERAKNGLLTHVDRKSGFLLADKITSWKSAHILERTASRFSKLPREKRRTCTYDNGSEFAQYELIEKLTKMNVYFAFPYHSWERGTNENTNGLLRQFFPKKTSLADVTQENIEKIVKLINNRPRKRLGYLFPSEVFNCNSN